MNLQRPIVVLSRILRVSSVMMLQLKPLSNSDAVSYDSAGAEQPPSVTRETPAPVNEVVNSTATRLGCTFAKDRKIDGPNVSIKNADGEWIAVDASAVFSRNMHFVPTPVQVAPSSRGISFQELQILQREEDALRSKTEQPRPRLHRRTSSELDEKTLRDGTAALEKMRDFLAYHMKKATSGTKTADYLELFRHNFIHAILCSSDVKTCLENMLPNDHLLDAAEKIATYGLHSIAEFATLEDHDSGHSVIDWEDTPMHRKHEWNSAYIRVLAHEIAQSVNKVRGFQAKHLARMTSLLFLGRHRTGRENYTFASHIQALIATGSEDREDVSGRKMYPGMTIDKYVLTHGDDRGFEPPELKYWERSDALAGSKEKIETLANRIRRGKQLWHPKDRGTYDGCVGGIDPRD